MMKVELLSITSNPEQLIAQAYGICTGKDSIPVGNIPKWIKLGHLTPVEHAVATLLIEGISRSCSHQLVRHRLASYSQRSQRYCNEENVEFVEPAEIRDYTVPHAAWDKVISLTKEAYGLMLAMGVPQEDARFILPNATCTSLIMTANFREWRHIIQLRTAPAAQWEIRALMKLIWRRLDIQAPHVFGDL